MNKLSQHWLRVGPGGVSLVCSESPRVPLRPLAGWYYGTAGVEVALFAHVPSFPDRFLDRGPQGT